MKLVLLLPLFLNSFYSLLAQNIIVLEFERSAVYDEFAKTISRDLRSYEYQLYPLLVEWKKTDSVNIFRNDELYMKLPYSESYVLKLPDGDYVFEYNTFYGKNKSTPYTFEKKKSNFYIINLYVDDLPVVKSDTTFLPQLPETDTLLIINVQMENMQINEVIGRYIEVPDTIKIFKNKRSTFVAYRDTRRKLTRNEIIYVENYVQKMRHLNLPEKFHDVLLGQNIIQINNERIVQNELTFQWFGFELLKWSLALTEHKKQAD